MRRSLIPAIAFGGLCLAYAGLQPGASVTDELPRDPGAISTFDLDVTEADALTIEARSLDFDVRLAVFRIDGDAGEKAVAEDDDGLAGSDSRLGLAGQPGRYRLVVSSSGDFDPGGEFSVLVTVGEAPRSDPTARSEADEAYWRHAEERAIARGDAAHRARCLSGRAGVLEEKGRPEEALELTRQALALAEARYGLEDRHVGMIQGEIGVRLYRSGEVEEAETALRRSLSILERTVAPDDPRIGMTLNALGGILPDLGDYEGAREMAERALRIRERVYGPDHTLTASSLSNLASVLDDMGAREEALALYQRALAILESTNGPDHPKTATAVNNIGYVLARMGRAEEARACYERALAIRERQLGVDHPLYALSLQNLGVTLRDTGDLERSLELLQRALDLREARLGPDHPDVAVTLGNVAVALHELGRDEEALVLDERALEIRRRRLGPKNPAVARQLAQHARILAGLGRVDEAIGVALEAEAIGREHLRTTARYLPERQALRYAAVRSGGLDAALGVAAEARGAHDAGRLWDAVARSRALVLDEMARRLHSLQASDESATRVARQRLTRVVSRYTRLLYGGAPAAEIEAARSEKEEAERALAASSARFRDEMGVRDLGLAEMARGIPEGAALLALTRYTVPIRASRTGRSRYVAFVRPAGDPTPRMVFLGDAAPIDELAVTWRAAIARTAVSDLEAAKARELEARSSGARLRELVWDPVARLLEGAATVFVVPDGVVSLVPLAALPVDGSRYLIEQGPRIHYLSAERDLLDLKSREAPEGALLAMGGPAYDGPADGVSEVAGTVYRGATATCSAFRGLRFQPLPLAAREAAEVAALFEDGAKREAHVLTGAEATETAFKQRAPGSAYLHLATHGFVASDACGDRDGAATDPPLQLSGLAFAGANRRADAARDQEDGILTAEEIAALDLSRVRWVALSACETGVGTVAAGEGVLGLRRGFAVAGARTLVLTLWSVDDRDARRWMRALYGAHARPGVDTAAAMREASREVLRERRARGLDTSPLHWGSFVASGDWR